MNYVSGPPEVEACVEAIRHFDLFYGKRLKELHEGARLQELHWTETEVFREMGELGAGCPPAWLAPRLGVDRSYLVRILRKLCAYGYAVETMGERDRRERLYELTESGRRVFKGLRDQHHATIRGFLVLLPSRQQRRLVEAMGTIKEVLCRDPMVNLIDCFRESRRGLRRSPSRRGAP